MNGIHMGGRAGHKDDVNQFRSIEGSMIVEHDPGKAPGPSSRVLVPATLALWFASWCVLTAKSYADGVPNLLEGSLVRAGLCLFGGGLCFLIHLVLRRLRTRSFGRKILAGALLAPVAAEIYGWTNAGAAYLLLGTPVQISSGATIFILSFYALIFFSWVTMYLAVSYGQQVAAAERRAAEARTLASAAQLRALRYQLNPHFLFNTLNSLSSLILESRLREADQMVERLAAFLRSSLTTDPLVMIRVADELELQRLYLGIEQVRFPDLALSAEMDPDAGNGLVPPLILQPLVENAVKFAVANSLDPARIDVSVRRDGDRLNLSVSDDGPGQSEHKNGTGVGLRNVRQRLEALYGTEASLEAEPLSPRGYRVRIGLPYETRSCSV